MFYFRFVSTVAGFLAASVYGVVIAFLRRDRSRVAHDYARMLARLTRPGLGLRTEVRGREKMNRRPCIYISNHQSIYDAPVLAELYPPATVVIGKRELKWIPFFGWLYWVTGNIMINRRDNPSSVGRLREVERAILAERKSVWIFPEGTRSRTPGRLLPFKKGAFYMAVATGAPLVPVVVAPVQACFDLRRRMIRPATIEVRVLDAIETVGMNELDVPILIANAHAQMQEALTDMAGVAAAYSNAEPSERSIHGATAPPV